MTAPAAAPVSRRRRRLTVRLTAAALVAAGLVAGTVAAIAAPWPVVAREPVRVVVTPAAAQTVIACPGPLLVLGRDAAAAGQLDVAAAVSVTSAPTDPAPAVAPLAVEGRVPGAEPPALASAPSQGGPATVAAAQSAAVAASDLAGFAASACRPALSESWLVAGSTATGAADVVLLANPGAVPATVTLTVYGAQGVQVPPGGDELVVPARTQRVVPLAGLTLGEVSPVIRVTAEGAPVQAALQASVIRTLIPGGVDQVGAIAAPALDVTLPGVVVSDAADGTSPATVLRLLAPSATTSATVSVIPVGGGAGDTGAPLVVPLTAGLPAELELAGLAPGAYTVRVTADAPVLAAVWHADGFGEGSDFGWYSAAPPITVPTVFAVADGPAPQLTLANSGTADASVQLAQLGGAAQTVSVPAGGSTALPLVAGGGYTLDPGAQAVAAAVTYAGPGALASYPVWGADAAAPPIVVYP